jgi:serine/threonine-protein kinase
MTSDESILNYIKIGKSIANLIDSCLEVNPSRRPLMKNIREILESELLFGKHKATIIFDRKAYVLETINKAVKISRGINDSLKITYNGHDFIMTDVLGYISVNNIKVSDGDELKGSSIIVLGNPELGPRRKFVTFDISYPEVVL